VWETGEVHTEIWWGYLRERGHMVDLVLDVRMILKLNCSKLDGEAWTGLIWLRLEIDGSLL
jgi:hypothetical protein